MPQYDRYNCGTFLAGRKADAVQVFSKILKAELVAWHK
jgi:hypothetical protein